MMLNAGSSSRSTSNRLRRYISIQGRYARDIAARVAQAGDKSQLDRIGPRQETIGIVAVAALAANAAATLLPVAITLT
jgi:hypothetical protein